MLSALAERGLHASFFVCGKDLRDPARRDLVRRAHAAGHRIGNHTLTHAIELGATTDPGAAAREIGGAQALLGELASPERWFRPYGAGGVLGPRLLSEAAIAYLRAGAYSLVLWNSVPRDWEDPTGWPARALADIERQDWTLLVLHDVPTGAMAALLRLPRRRADARRRDHPRPPARLRPDPQRRSRRLPRQPAVGAGLQPAPRDPRRQATRDGGRGVSQHRDRHHQHRPRRQPLQAGAVVADQHAHQHPVADPAQMAEPIRAPARGRGGGQRASTA
ncbi:MAG: polysaccharide deacetylase family protein [Candidatus Binatia bacterium]